MSAPSYSYQIRLLLLLISVALFAVTGFPQSRDSVSREFHDSLKGPFLERINKVSSDETIRSVEKFKRGRVSIRQNEILAGIKRVNQETKRILKKGIDTAKISADLATLKTRLPLVGNGVFNGQGSIQTQRNLSVTQVILGELLVELKEDKAKLDAFTNTLTKLKDEIDSLYADTALYAMPADSVGIIKYIRKLSVLQRELGPVDTMHKEYLAGVQDLQTRVDYHVGDLEFLIEDVQKFRNGLSQKALAKELPEIWNSAQYSRPLKEIVRFSFEKEKLALLFYISDYRGRIILLISLIGCSAFFLRSLRHNILRDDRRDIQGPQLVIRYPVYSAIVIVVSLFQFAFIDPPFVVNFIFWILNTLSLCWIIKGFISPYWLKFWLTIIVFFALAGLLNLVLQSSRTERWMMLALAAFGTVYGGRILLSNRKRELREYRILFFIGFMVLCESASFLLNVFGRYNLSKTLMIAGYSELVIAITFLWTVRLINEGLALASSVYTHPDKKLFYINFDRVGEKVPGVFYVALTFGWFVLVSRHFYAFHELLEPVSNFISEQRTWGDYTFSVRGLFVFILIFFLSLFISRIISFFTTDPQSAKPASNSRKLSLGSWILLIRIAIISLGLFLAFAASGIPLDRITIILGALGVGVGLGLQGLVNNLVSGLIIAFEKPVNVGDLIEVNGILCTMKSIGFRSSIVVGVDGSHIVIPNGDLLSQHLVNWRMGRNMRRVSLSVGIAYGTDVNEVKLLLEKILNDHDEVLKNPPPVVVAKSFSAYSIEFDLHLWVDDVRKAFIVKSEIIDRVNKVFKADGITIPYPQQDIHVVSLPEAGQQKPEG